MGDLVPEASPHDLFPDLLDAVDEQVLHLRFLRHLPRLGRREGPQLPGQFFILVLESSDGVCVVGLDGLHEPLHLVFDPIAAEFEPIAQHEIQELFEFVVLSWWQGILPFLFGNLF